MAANLGSGMIGAADRAPGACAIWPGGLRLGGSIRCLWPSSGGFVLLCQGVFVMMCTTCRACGLMSAAGISLSRAFASIPSLWSHCIIPWRWSEGIQ